MSVSWVERGVGGCAMPWPDEIDSMIADGVRGLVTLTRHVPDGLPADGLAHLHLPIRDFHPPTQEQLEAAVAFMDAVRAEGGAVVVHCAAGLGRTGTILAAWLVEHGRTSDEAIDEVRRKRPGSIETSAQEHAIWTFAHTRGRAS